MHKGQKTLSTVSAVIILAQIRNPESFSANMKYTHVLNRLYYTFGVEWYPILWILIVSISVYLRLL
jgi:hypothetical protein